MALTQQVKTELATVRVLKPETRVAELVAMLRFSGGLHIVSGRIVIESEFDTGAAARRLRKAISDLYGYESEFVIINGSGIRRGTRYVLRLVRDGEALARQTGLIDSHGRPVRGLPPHVVGAGMNEQDAVWRGAFLARGSLTEPGRSMALEITCPSSEAALALVARPAGSTSPPRPGRSVRWTGSSFATVTRSRPCSPGWGRTSRCCCGGTPDPP